METKNGTYRRVVDERYNTILTGPAETGTNFELTDLAWSRANQTQQDPRDFYVEEVTHPGGDWIAFSGIEGLPHEGAYGDIYIGPHRHLAAEAAMEAADRTGEGHWVQPYGASLNGSSFCDPGKAPGDPIPGDTVWRQGVGRTWNLTPHTVSVDIGNGDRVHFLPEGYVARVTAKVETCEDKGPYGVDLAQAPTFGDIKDAQGLQSLPIDHGDTVIVSLLAAPAVRKAVPVGARVLVPDTGSTAERDPKGAIVAVKRLHLISADDSRP